MHPALHKLLEIENLEGVWFPCIDVFLSSVCVLTCIQIDALYECCNAFYKKEGEDASTVSCPKYSLLKLKMEQRAKGIS
jgi:hypothetical protein